MWLLMMVMWLLMMWPWLLLGTALRRWLRLHRSGAAAHLLVVLTISGECCVELIYIVQMMGVMQMTPHCCSWSCCSWSYCSFRSHAFAPTPERGMKLLEAKQK
jgi:hypothetical protein